jgi:malonate decarboxylase beta subunit
MLGPFERLKSPWLERQGIVAQADDGVVIARGNIAGKPAAVAAIEGAFQGGSLGEVSGAKIAALLECSCQSNQAGGPLPVILCLESGGVRLQEANLGLAAIAEIHSAMISLRALVPVIGIIAGPVGCFGGMSMAAALCSHLIVTREARLGLNGPEVIEQEAGVEEVDSHDRPLIWSLMGGERRCASHLGDTLIEDDADAIAAAVRAVMTTPAPRAEARSRQIERYLDQVQRSDQTRSLDRATRPDRRNPAGTPPESRGQVWLRALTGADGKSADAPAAVRTVDARIGSELARFIAVVPDPSSTFHRARHGEIGLLEAWTLAVRVREAIAADAGGTPRPIIAIVDSPGQAYGRTEELLGQHLACAAAVDAYVCARQAGHPVIALLVGHAMSGAFLAHGYQAHRLIALDDAGVLVHAMGQRAAARITRRSVEDVLTLARTCAPMSYDIGTFAGWGLLHALIDGVNADRPTPENVTKIRAILTSAIADARTGVADLGQRLQNDAARKSRAASIEVRRRLAEVWHAV